MAVNLQPEHLPFADKTIALVEELVRIVDQDTSDFVAAAKHLNAAYRKGRSDCLQETLDLKKLLLPQELRLLARLLDYASSVFAQSGYPSEGSSDFQLENTKRNRKLVKELAPNEETPTETDFLTVKDYTLAKHMAHRVREALAEEEG